MNDALRQEAGAEGVRAELSAEQRLLDAELGEAARLEEALQQLDDERKRARLAYERAKIMREEAAGAIERLKYSALLKRFPSMEDTTRLVLSRIMADGRCMVCNTPAQERQRELEEHVARGRCPICGAEPEVQDNVVAQYEFDQAKLVRERERAARARREEAAVLAELKEFAGNYKETLSQWESVEVSILARKDRNRHLRARLPQTVTSKDYENQLRSLRSDHNQRKASRASHLQELRTLFAERRDAITDKSKELVTAFSELVEVLLVEEVRLVQVDVQPPYLEAPGPTGERVEVPAYAAEMTGAARPALTRRGGPERGLRVAAGTHRSRVPASAFGGVRRSDHLRDGDAGGKSGRYLDGARREDACRIRVQGRQSARRDEQSDECEHRHGDVRGDGA